MTSRGRPTVALALSNEENQDRALEANDTSTLENVKRQTTLPYNIEALLSPTNSPAAPVMSSSQESHLFSDSEESFVPSDSEQGESST